MIGYIKSKIQKTLKQSVRRRLLDPIDRRATNRNIRRLANELRASPALDRRLITEFRRAWGNESFSADITYISEMAARVARCNGPVLECGSGITTILAGVLAERNGVTIWTLEQDPERTEHMMETLKQCELQTVKLIHAPLREYDGYVWYDISGQEIPKHIELALVDGPAVFEHWGNAHAQWRYGLLPVLASKGTYVKELLLDDAAERRAPNTLQRWSSEFGMSLRMVTTPDGHCAYAIRPGE